VPGSASTRSCGWNEENHEVGPESLRSQGLEPEIKVITADLLSDGPNHPDDMELDVIAYAHDRLHLEV